MRPWLLFLVCVTFTALPSSTLVAQQPADGLAGNAMGVSMDRFMYEGSSVVAMSYRFSTLRPGRLGSRDRGLALAPDIGAGYNLPVPGGCLLFKAGGSAITAMWTGGVLFVPGFHVGARSWYRPATGPGYGST